MYVRPADLPKLLPPDPDDVESLEAFFATASTWLPKLRSALEGLPGPALLRPVPRWGSSVGAYTYEIQRPILPLPYAEPTDLAAALEQTLASDQPLLIGWEWTEGPGVDTADCYVVVAGQLEESADPRWQSEERYPLDRDAVWLPFLTISADLRRTGRTPADAPTVAVPHIGDTDRIQLLARFAAEREYLEALARDRLAAVVALREAGLSTARARISREALAAGIQSWADAYTDHLPAIATALLAPLRSLLDDLATVADARTNPSRGNPSWA